jgi:hypothetical protein
MFKNGFICTLLTNTFGFGDRGLLLPYGRFSRHEADRLRLRPQM